MATEEDVAKFIFGSSKTRRAGILYHSDADGIAGAVIIYKTLQRIGCKDIVPIPLGRALNPHSQETKVQLPGYDLSRLIIVDSGSGAGEILSGVPVLIIDHHRPSGIPQAEVFFNTYGESSIRPTSLAAYDTCNLVVKVGDLDWVAAIGLIGDLGPKAPFPIIKESFQKYGRKNVTDSVVLVNAGSRHHDYKVDLAFNVLFNAGEPADIAQHRIAGAEELERLRREVQDEL